MMNELLFIFHISVISLSTLLFARLGKEALISYISLLFVVANIFVIKQITLFNFYATSADAFILGISFGLNILQEFYGKEWARKTIYISFFCSFFYLIVGQFIVAYLPANEDCAHLHFVFLMQNTARLIIASFIAYLITQSVDIQVYGFLKKISNGKYFIIRNYAALCLSQLLDTILFSFLGLYGIVHNIFNIIAVSYMIKICAIFLMTPFLMITKKIICKSTID